jgi:hypothetical protein
VQALLRCCHISWAEFDVMALSSSDTEEALSLLSSSDTEEALRLLFTVIPPRDPVSHVSEPFLLWQRSI